VLKWISKVVNCAIRKNYPGKRPEIANALNLQGISDLDQKLKILGLGAGYHLKNLQDPTRTTIRSNLN
jgi:hypothetical protein